MKKIQWLNEGRLVNVGFIKGNTFITSRDFKFHYFRKYDSFFSISKELLKALQIKYHIDKVIIGYDSRDEGKKYYLISVDDIFRHAETYIDVKGVKSDEQWVVRQIHLHQMDNKPEFMQENLDRW